MLHVELGIPVPEVLRHWVVLDGYADRDSRYLDQRFGVARLSPELCTSDGFQSYAEDEQVHGYLASQFGTKCAIAPVTTRAERDLCRFAVDEWQRSSGRRNILPSADLIVRNLGPTRPPEQPVRHVNLAAPAPVPRLVDSSAPTIFIHRESTQVMCAESARVAASDHAVL